MIDTHAHLEYFDNKEEIISRMQADGLEIVVNIGTTIESSKQGINLASLHDNIYATVGIYPEYSKTITAQDLSELESLAHQPKVVAVGEIGLDYHSEDYDKASQKALLISQLEIANRVGLPFCIHCRNAASDMYEILSKHKHLMKHSGLMHCYSEGGEWVDKFVELGMYISLSGNITFKKVDTEFIKRIPLDRLLVETDAPYLAPTPLRGTVNEPKNVRFVIEKIADVLGKTFEEIETLTSENAKRFYYKINSK